MTLETEDLVWISIFERVWRQFDFRKFNFFQSEKASPPPPLKSFWHIFHNSTVQESQKMSKNVDIQSVVVFPFKLHRYITICLYNLVNDLMRLFSVCMFLNWMRWTFNEHSNAFCDIANIGFLGAWTSSPKNVVLSKRRWVTELPFMSEWEVFISIKRHSYRSDSNRLPFHPKGHFWPQKTPLNLLIIILSSSTLSQNLKNLISHFSRVDTNLIFVRIGRIFRPEKKNKKTV